MNWNPPAAAEASKKLQQRATAKRLQPETAANCFKIADMMITHIYDDRKVQSVLCTVPTILSHGFVVMLRSYGPGECSEHDHVI